MDVSFPADFLWGAATAAYQVEGAAAADGKQPSIWDVFSHLPGKTRNGDNGDIAADHYRRFSEDLALMRELGLRSYRFSVSWPRIITDSSGTINRSGIDHYRRVAEELLSADIVPMVTLYHWDLPQWAQDEGGWLSRDTASRFADYAAVMAGALGDLVPLWLTLNEPWTAVFMGYVEGRHAPGTRSYADASHVIHHMMLAHGLAVSTLRSGLANTAQVGITLSTAMITPWSDRDDDVAAARHFDGEQNRVFLDPLFRGTYPEDLTPLMPALADESVVHAGDLETISQPLDYLGVNFYITALARADPAVPMIGARLIPPDGPLTGAGIAAVPEGLGVILRRIRAEYTPIPVYVTETGYSGYDYIDPEGTVKDPERIGYLRRSLLAIHEAIQSGVDVRGAYVWSLLDNLEWERGFGTRFGLVFVDYGNQQRTIKQSGWWYSDVIRKGGW